VRNANALGVTALVEGSTMPMNHGMTSTTFDIAGFRVVKTVGVVRGLTVRSRSIVGSFVGGVQTIFGGNISIYAELCEHARQEAFRLMILHAEQVGANAIVGIRYDANEIMGGVTEVLCYGTAVQVERVA
jgi:uncharacterized protein YbjQ (UPF0145 family)